MTTLAERQVDDILARYDTDRQAWGWDAPEPPAPDPETDPLTGSRGLMYGLILGALTWLVIMGALYGGARLLEPLLRR
jgi:hypothetical protein